MTSAAQVQDAPRTPTAWTVLAHLLRPQGRKGELLAELLTDFPERFTSHPQVHLAKPNYTGPAQNARPILVVNHWQPVGRNQGRVVLHFQGIDSIDDAELLNGLDVIIPDEARVELEPEAEYIDDLVGCRVLDCTDPASPIDIGEVTGIDFPTTPDGGRRLPDAAPLLTVLTPTGDEVLIPYVQSFLISLSIETKRIEMTLPPGLLELNRPGTPSHDHSSPGGADDQEDDPLELDELP